MCVFQPGFSVHLRTCAILLLSCMYLQAEQLFEHLSEAKVKFVDWVVLGAVDLDSLVDQH